MDQYSLQPLGGFAVHRGDRRIDTPPACQRLGALVDWHCTVDWHRTTDLIELLHSDGAHGQLVSDFLPLLRAGDLLDK